MEKVEQKEFNKLIKDCFESGIKKVVIHFNNNARLEADEKAFRKMLQA